MVLRDIDHLLFDECKVAVHRSIRQWLGPSTIAQTWWGLACGADHRTIPYMNDEFTFRMNHALDKLQPGASQDDTTTPRTTVLPTLTSDESYADQPPKTRNVVRIMPTIPEDGVQCRPRKITLSRRDISIRRWHHLNMRPLARDIWACTQTRDADDKRMAMQVLFNTFRHRLVYDVWVTRTRTESCVEMLRPCTPHDAQIYQRFSDLVRDEEQHRIGASQQAVGTQSRKRVPRTSLPSTAAIVQIFNEISQLSPHDDIVRDDATSFGHDVNIVAAKPRTPARATVQEHPISLWTQHETNALAAISPDECDGFHELTSPLVNLLENRDDHSHVPSSPRYPDDDDPNLPARHTLPQHEQLVLWVRDVDALLKARDSNVGASIRAAGSHPRTDIDMWRQAKEDILHDIEAHVKDTAPQSAVEYVSRLSDMVDKIHKAAATETDRCNREYTRYSMLLIDGYYGNNDATPDHDGLDMGLSPEIANIVQHYFADMAHSAPVADSMDNATPHTCAESSEVSLAHVQFLEEIPMATVDASL